MDYQNQYRTMQDKFLRIHQALHSQNNRIVMYQQNYFYYLQKSHILHLLSFPAWLLLLTYFSQKFQILVSLRLCIPLSLAVSNKLGKNLAVYMEDYKA